MMRADLMTQTDPARALALIDRAFAEAGPGAAA